MYYVYLSSYPALAPETFVLVEVDSEQYNNPVLETLPWEDAPDASSQDVRFELLQTDNFRSADFVIRCDRAFERNNSTACADLARDMVDTVQDAYEFFRDAGYGAPELDGRNIISRAWPVSIVPFGYERCVGDTLGYHNFVTRRVTICLDLSATTIEGDVEYTIAHEVFHTVAHNTRVMPSYTRLFNSNIPFRWLSEGTATLAAGTARLRDTINGQYLYLDPRFNKALSLRSSFFNQEYNVQGFFKYLGERLDATDLGFLLPIFEAGSNIGRGLFDQRIFNPVEAFDELLRNNEFIGYVVPGNINSFSKLYYAYTLSFFGHDEDSQGGGYDDEDRICSSCSRLNPSDYSGLLPLITTHVFRDDEGNATLPITLSPLSVAGFTVSLRDGLTLSDIVRGLPELIPSLRFFIFEDQGFAYYI